jgi:H+-translocating NAD(P) transhydrogenase subunit alpha
MLCIGGAAPLVLSTPCTLQQGHSAPALALAALSSQIAMDLIIALTVFVLALFVGFEIITKVPPTLHTPLMSGSNAISGITIVGAILAVRTGSGWLAGTFGFIAIVLAMVNVVGGFLVTHRMLGMFRRKG